MKLKLIGFFSLFLLAISIMGCMAWPSPKSSEWKTYPHSKNSGLAIAVLWKMDLNGSFGFRNAMVADLLASNILNNHKSAQIEKYLGPPTEKSGSKWIYVVDSTEKLLVVEFSGNQSQAKQENHGAFPPSQIKNPSFGEAAGEILVIINDNSMPVSLKQNLLPGLDKIALGNAPIGMAEVSRVWGDPKMEKEQNGKLVWWYELSPVLENTEARDYAVFSFGDGTLDKVFPISITEVKGKGRE